MKPTFPYLSPGLQTWLRLAAPGLLLLVALPDIARSQGARYDNGPAEVAPKGPFAPIPDAIYESSFQKDAVEIFSPNGVFLGGVGKIPRPTGVVFDQAGNLFIASDHRSVGYSIKKFATDGTLSNFATASLGGPHGLALDASGLLYVANSNNDTVVRFTPDGVGTVFADRGDKLVQPIALAFDSAGALFVSNARGGPTRSGQVVKVTPNGVGTVFADVGFQTAYGLAFDSAGNLYVSNNTGNRVEKFAPDGTDLGVFCDSGLSAPLGMIFDRAGYLYVANGGNDTIEKFAPDGTDLGTFTATREGPHFMAIYTLP